MHWICFFAIIGALRIETQSHHMKEYQMDFIILIEWFVNGNQINISVRLLHTHFGEQAVHVAFQIVILENWSITEILDSVFNGGRRCGKLLGYTLASLVSNVTSYLRRHPFSRRTYHVPVSIWLGLQAVDTAIKIEYSIPCHLHFPIGKNGWNQFVNFWAKPAIISNLESIFMHENFPQMKFNDIDKF